MAGPLLEREGAVASIDEALQRARDGRGQAVFVVGEAGLGKTSLVELSVRLAGDSFDLAVGHGDAAEATLPFGILSQALAGSGNSPAIAKLPALDAAVPDARGAYFYATLRSFQRRKRPALIGVDDLHWADPDSLALVSFLCLRIAQLPVAIVGTLRPWPPAALDTVHRLSEMGHVALEHLTPLSVEAADKLLRAHLGATISSLETEQVWELCSGNPFLLEQAAAVLEGRRPGLGLEGLGNGHAQLLLSRFAGVSNAAMQYAQTAAVFGTRFRPALVPEVAGLSAEAAEEALNALSRAGLIRGSDGWAEFVHPLFGQVLYEELPVAVRSQRHALAFRSLRAHRVDPAEAAEQARRAQLEGDPEVIETLTEAGRRALAAGALAQARELLRAAVDTAQTGASAELLIALGDALIGGDDFRSTIATYRRVLARPDLPPPLRIAARSKLARALAQGGALVESRAEFDAATADALVHDPAQAVQLLLDQAWGMFLSTGASALALATRARALAQGADPLTRRRADAAWAFCAFISGDPSGIDLLRSAARQAAADPVGELADLAWSWGTLGCYLIIAKFTERFADCEEVFRIGTRVAEEASLLGAWLTLEISQADAYHRLGRLREGLLLIERRMDLAEMVPFASLWAAIGMAAITHDIGRLKESQDWTRIAEERGARYRGDLPVFWIWLWHIIGRHEIHAGRLAEAAALYGQVEELARQAEIREPCAIPWARDAIQTFLACDRAVDAQRVLADLEAVSEPLPCRWPRVVIATSRAAFAERDGDRAKAESHFLEALGLHTKMEMPLAEAETLILYGGFLRRGRELRRARSAFARALEVAERVGAGRLVELARAELWAAGGRQRHMPAVHELTPQEIRVARLARDGLTDKQIARGLAISTKTVEAHLQHIYRKLGVQSRRELMRRPAPPSAFEDPVAASHPERSVH